MSSSFIFRPHIYDGNTITTPDVLIDNVYVVDSHGTNLSVSRITNDRLTTAPEIQVLGYDTIAEAAILLIAAGAGMLMGIASNHKYINHEDPQFFSKPISRQVWRFQHVADHWKYLSMQLSCGTGEMIQNGKLAEFAPIDEIIPLISSDQSSLQQGTAVFCVGLPMLKSGKSSSSYSLKLFDQEKDQILELDYQVSQI